MKRMRQAFTLMEVNLAIFIMATGVLGMVSLYSLGFRESRQSEEDVASAGLADAFFAPLVAGLSATNMTWSGWCNAVPQVDNSYGCNGLAPNGGWVAYVSKLDSDNDGRYESYRVASGCNSLARQVFDRIVGEAPAEYKGSFPAVSSGYYYGLVATRKGSAISLAFRASRRREALMSQPVYYTEVHFQGRTDQ
ncbi:MAG: hypothetical protein IJH50_06550 [Kiritimatiellae bacterium]|nr:hypothetical protein [Kiritimatiellia bacterium]